MKKAVLPIAAIILLAAGIIMVVKPELVPLGSYGSIERAVIIRETRTDTPLSQQWIELFVAAEKLGIPVWDKDVLGKAKNPSPEAQPYLDAVGKIELPALALKWANGDITVQSCPSTIDALKKAAGKQ